MRKLFSWTKRWLGALGLILGTVGVVVVWIYALPQPSFDGDTGVIADAGTPMKDGKTAGQHRAEAKATELRYRYNAQAGLGLILAGFLCQLAGEISDKKSQKAMIDRRDDRYGRYANVARRSP